MSQGSRIFGAYLNGATIGGVSYLAVAKSIKPSWTFNTQMATALRDLGEYPVGIREKSSFTGDFFISTANTSGEGGPGGTLWTKAIAKTQLAYALVDNSTSGAINTLSGNGIITECSQTISDQAQEIAITVSTQGLLTSSIT